MVSQDLAPSPEEIELVPINGMFIAAQIGNEDRTVYIKLADGSLIEIGTND